MHISSYLSIYPSIYLSTYLSPYYTYLTMFLMSIQRGLVIDGVAR